jgi:murein hydrolase activator
MPQSSNGASTPSRRRPRKRDRRALACGVCAVLAVLPAFAGKTKVPVPEPRPTLATAEPAPSSDAGPAVTAAELSHAMPAKALGNLPSTEDQYRSLKGEIAKVKPAADAAKSASDALQHETETLAQKLVDMAARVQALESEKLRLDSEVANLSAENDRLTAGFRRDRVSVTRLLAVLQRVEIDMPPAMALKPGDALATARGAMLVGATLPRVYGEAAALSRRIVQLRDTRVALLARRTEAAANAKTLGEARLELDQLLAMKRLEADAATQRYGDLRQKLDDAAAKAADLEALLQKVAALRSAAVTQSIVTVTAKGAEGDAKLARDALFRPVTGELFQGGMDGVGGPAAPGVTYLTDPSARVVSPSDGVVLFAGPYHKSGQVLILEMSGGYDAVLAGMDHLDVHPEDQVLAGEPVGTMAKTNPKPRLYFELRHGGRAMSPAPYIGVVLRKAKKS